MHAQHNTFLLVIHTTANFLKQQQQQQQRYVNNNNNIDRNQFKTTTPVPTLFNTLTMIFGLNQCRLTAFSNKQLTQQTTTTTTTNILALFCSISAAI
jgi:hypothetical protein